jgi:hypothetical protein
MAQMGDMSSPPKGTPAHRRDRRPGRNHRRVASMVISLKAGPRCDDSEVIPTGTTSEYLDESVARTGRPGKDGRPEVAHRAQAAEGGSAIIRAFWGYQDPWVYFLPAGAAAEHRERRPRRLRGRTGSVDLTGRTCEAWPGGR